MNMLAQMTWPQWFLAALLISVCVLLMIVILLQRGRGGGLAGAFGGGGGGGAFGAKTGDLFTWITVVVASLFLLLAVVANFALDRSPPKPPVVATPTEEAAAPETGAETGVEGASGEGEAGTTTPAGPATGGNQGAPAPDATAGQEGTSNDDVGEDATGDQTPDAPGDAAPSRAEGGDSAPEPSDTSPSGDED